MHGLDEHLLHTSDTQHLTQCVELIFESEDMQWNGLSYSQAIEALNMAAKWHKKQTRIAGPDGLREPYINHPLRNVIRANHWGVRDGELLVAVLLHDVVEDCAHRIVGQKKEVSAVGMTKQREEALDVLAEMFSTRVADCVEAVTNPVWGEDVSREVSRDVYIDHLFNVLRDGDVFVVKFSDFVDNAGSLDASFDEGKLEMFEHLYLKYGRAYGVFAARLEGMGFSPVVVRGMRDSLEDVGRSLSVVGEMIGAE